jgi:hypothetical protein
MTETEPEHQFDVTIYLKGGQSFTWRALEWATRKNLAGELAEANWENVTGHPRLRYLNIDQIAAVIVADVEEPS